MARTALPEAGAGRDPRGSYLRELVGRLWDYRERRFGGAALFDRDVRTPGRPPVFLRAEADRNVLTRPGAGDGEARRVAALVHREKRHRWFASMRSSQALAQSVFGNLLVHGRLDLLAGLSDPDDGLPAFFAAAPPPGCLGLEHDVRHLGEPRPTSADVFVTGPDRLAVECKLAEEGVGACSRPRLTPDRPEYAEQHCDGSYRAQRGRGSRCALTEIGVRYWEHVPRLFRWDPGRDHAPCPLQAPYQLIRNVLAACVAESGVADADGGHAVLVYDERNPAFGPDGVGWSAWSAVRQALLDRSRLRRCPWQALTARLRCDGEMRWLAEALAEKYGL